jgi:hypothetical protein
MSMGPMSGVVGSAAGAPLSQTSGSETERAQKDASAHQRQVETDKKASDAAGIGQTEEDQGTSERDADGRRFWETTDQKISEQDDDQSEPPRKAKDPTGNSGNSLDLTG